MSNMRKMFPAFFTKKAKEERAKMPKEPTSPKLPSEPQPPSKYLYNKKNTLCITDNGEQYVTIAFSKIMELRSQINVKDELININIASSSSYRSEWGGDSGSEVDSVYFEWYEELENPEYQKDFQKYQEKLKKYHIDKEQYQVKKEEYDKNMKAYKKELKAYRLQQMKEQKARLEAQIEKEESKQKKKL
jgi:hypothetical protein